MLRSAVGAYISCYVLGIKDRNFSNILVSTSVGRDLMFIILNLEYCFNTKEAYQNAPPFAITPAIKQAFIDKDIWELFISLCQEAFLILQSQALTIINTCVNLFDPLSYPDDETIRSLLLQTLMIHTNPEQTMDKIMDDIERSVNEWEDFVKNVDTTPDVKDDGKKKKKKDDDLYKDIKVKKPRNRPIEEIKTQPRSRKWTNNSVALNNQGSVSLIGVNESKEKRKPSIVKDLENLPSEVKKSEDQKSEKSDEKEEDKSNKTDEDDEKSKVKALIDWNVQDVAEWAKENGLEFFIEKVVDQNIDGEALSNIGDKELEELGLKVGQRKKILKAITKAI